MDIQAELTQPVFLFQRLLVPFLFMFVKDKLPTDAAQYHKKANTQN
jgi:hypothetical protein